MDIQKSSWNSWVTPEDLEAEKSYNAAFLAAIKTLADLVGPGILVTLTNEYGATVKYRNGVLETTEVMSVAATSQVEESIEKARQVFIDHALYMKNPAIVRAYEVHLAYNIPLDEAALLAIPVLLEHIANLEKLMNLTPLTSPVTITRADPQVTEYVTKDGLLGIEILN